jgi:hypothetical protein
VVIDRRYNKDSYELFRAGERVLFRRSFGQRVVLCRQFDCVEAIAFGVAVKKIALT